MAKREFSNQLAGDYAQQEGQKSTAIHNLFLIREVHFPRTTQPLVSA